jgi:hypothetical protein
MAVTLSNENNSELNYKPKATVIQLTNTPTCNINTHCVLLNVAVTTVTPVPDADPTYSLAVLVFNTAEF